MRILIISPWDGNPGAYTNGLSKGLSNYHSIKVVANFYDTFDTNNNYELDKCFFKYSDKITRNLLLRKCVRGCEYIYAYLHILHILNKEHYDIVHFQWCLNYDIDIFFLKIIRKLGYKLVLTAHNAIPHVSGETYIGKLKKLYSLFNIIIVHGVAIKNEFVKYFPQYKSKLLIQYHGDLLNKSTIYNINLIDVNLRNIIETSRRVYLFIGNIFENKGVDRLTTIWREGKFSNNSILVIAGSGSYKEFNDGVASLKGYSNFLYLPGYIDDNTLNYLNTKATILLLPYRHASMSGVVFSAASFKKTILCTDVGCLPEYVVNGEDSFVVNNNIDSFKSELLFIDGSISDEQLKTMGENLYTNVNAKYEWESIAKQLSNDYKNIFNQNI